MSLCIQYWVSDDLNWYCKAQKILLLNCKSYLNSLFDIEFGWRIWFWAPIPEIIFFLPFFLLSSLKKAVQVWSWNWLGETYCLPNWWKWISLKAPGVPWNAFGIHLIKLKRAHVDLCAKWRETWNFKYFKHCNLELQWYWKISVEQLCLLPGDFNTF